MIRRRAQSITTRATTSNPTATKTSSGNGRFQTPLPKPPRKRVERTLLDHDYAFCEI